jgi:TetR/AcrR family transcriptional regulator
LPGSTRSCARDPHPEARVYLLLAFADRNSPGSCLGDALVGERERLHDRVQQFFERVDLQLRQVLREAALRQDDSLRTTPEAAAKLLTAFIEGRMQQFLRSRFQHATLDAWNDDWSVLRHGLFEDGRDPAGRES